MYVCPLENNCTCMLSLVSYVDWRKNIGQVRMSRSYIKLIFSEGLKGIQLPIWDHGSGIPFWRASN